MAIVPADAALLQRHLESAFAHVEQATACAERLAARLDTDRLSLKDQIFDLGAAEVALRSAIATLTTPYEPTDSRRVTRPRWSPLELSHVGSPSS